MVLIERCYLDLLEVCSELEYGELHPDELVPTGEKVERGHFTNEQVRLLAAIGEYGTPKTVKVVAKTPIFAIFEIPTRVGAATKTVKLN
jgi:hypothetical protein